MKKIFCGLVILPMLFQPCVAFTGSSVYGPTKTNEHLYRIALKVRPNHNYSVQQVMVALLNKNPAAFSRPNVNYLKSGYRLALPTMEELDQIKPNFAFQSIDQQNQAWETGVDVAMNVLPTQKHIINKDIDSFIKAASSSTPAFVDMIRHPYGANIETTMTSFPVNDEGSQQSIQSFVETTNRFQQQTTDQIANLQQQNKNLEDKINQLNEQLRGVTYQFIQLSALVKSNNSTIYIKNVLDSFKKYAWGLGGSLLILVALSWYYRRLNQRQPSKTKPNTPSEYNFLEGEDSIPTKLDLARAYIDMGDAHAAQSTLRDVFQKGDEKQKQTAHDLMGKLNLGL